MSSLKVSVVIPALNEEATVDQVVATCLASEVVRESGEVLVIDSDSTDATARVAAEAGARVVNWSEVGPAETRSGKGEALWRGVRAARGEIIVFVDADVTSARPDWVDALVAPFADPAIHLVKASYQRELAGGPGGGRVTELTAKPLLRTLFPQLARLSQPLAGEYAIRRTTALAVPFVGGYGVEVGLLIDVASLHTPAALTETPLSTRRHRNRPLSELGPMADVVAATILQRAGVPCAGTSGVSAVPQRPAWNETLE